MYVKYGFSILFDDFVIFEGRKKNGQSVVKIAAKEERNEILRQASV